MNNRHRFARHLAGIALATASLAATAHQVWIEQTPAGATLYFGEFGENLREASPGLLDKFVKPVAHRISAKGASEALAVNKSAGGFALSARAAAGESIVAEEASYPLSERKTGETVVRSLYQPAARLVTDVKKAQPPQLTLDLVPTGQNAKGSVEVQAFYKGQPLPKAKVAVVTASGWAQEHHTDAQGKLTVNVPWRGTYVLEISHTDIKGGERAAAAGGEPEKYDRASYVTSLTLTRSEGVPALPASPPAAPNKAD